MGMVPLCYRRTKEKAYKRTSSEDTILYECSRYLTPFNYFRQESTLSMIELGVCRVASGPC